MTDMLFDPTGGSEAAKITYAPRPAQLEGLRLGLVENTKHNSESILRKLAERLDERYRIKVTHLDHKRSSSHAVAEEAINQLRRKADFVVAGVGD